MYPLHMKTWMALGGLMVALACTAAVQPEAQPENPLPKKVVYILPIREDITPSLVYVVRRGVKEAIENRASLLVLDMDTNGGRVDSTEKIISILNQFKGQTATYVNDKAFSAGAYIAVATESIFMAPQSVIGAAAPIMLAPGAGPQEMPDTMEVKMTSALSALMRANAEKNGHNPNVVMAMIDKSKELKIGDKVLCEKGQLLTLTDKEAAETYGNPPKPLLSAGTVADLDAVIEDLGYGQVVTQRIEATGAERLARWINMISPLLLIIGVAGIYIEIKTPGFGLPGIVGILAFLVYFLGGYVAGFSGLAWFLVFLLGLVLVVLELFFFPGTLIMGLAGAALMLFAVIMALVDIYPVPGRALPVMPSWDQLQYPLQQLLIALVGSVVVLAILARSLPKTPFYHALVSQSASAMQTEHHQDEMKKERLGQTGTTISYLRPSGKAQFGEQILDVVSQGDLIPKGTPVRIIGFNGTNAVVEAT